MLKLYGGLRSRASIVQWYLEEIGAEYEFVQLNMQGGEHKLSSYLAINPMAQVPAIADGDFKLWESGAILIYLAEKFGKMPESIEGKAEVHQWVLFANSSLSMGLTPGDNRNEVMKRYLAPVNEILGNSTFMLGEEFGVVDVALGSLLAYIPMMFKDVDLSPYPNIHSYLQRLGDRPAFKKAIMKQG